MKSQSMSATGKLVLTFVVTLGLAVTIPQARAQTFNVVYNFTGGSDGGYPLDGLRKSLRHNQFGRRVELWSSDQSDQKRRGERAA